MQHDYQALTFHERVCRQLVLAFPMVMILAVVAVILLTHLIGS